MCVYTFWIWTANSLVGDRISTWVSLTSVSSICNTPIENVAVFPVPDWALNKENNCYTYPKHKH